MPKEEENIVEKELQKRRKMRGRSVSKAQFLYHVEILEFIIEAYITQMYIGREAYTDGTCRVHKEVITSTIIQLEAQ